MTARTSSITTRQSQAIGRSPVFYGWVIWAVATLGMIGSAPGQSFTVSLFLDDYIREFFTVPQMSDSLVTGLYGPEMLMIGAGMGRTIVSTLFGVGTFIAALSLTWVGRHIDRFGNRSVGTVIALLFALVLISLSFINGPLTIFLSFIAIRLLGQGSMFLSGSTAIAKWWRVRRGWMMGLALVGFALFQRIYLPQLEALISNYGWRATWVILGVAVGVIVVPVWWLLMRDSPETYGLVPDSPRARAQAGSNTGDEENWTLSEAMRTPLFWVFVTGRFTAGAIGTALIFHQVSIFGLLGHSREVIAANFGIIAIVNAIFTLGIGRIINRLRPGLVMAAQLGFMMVLLWLSMLATDTMILTVYALVFGVVMALGGSFDGSVWADLFGREHHGAIRGFSVTATVIGTAAGPVIFGFSLDTFGSYVQISWASIVVILFPLIASMTVKRPRKRLETAPGA